MVVGTLAGCSVPSGAVIGLSRALDGGLVAHLQVCQGHIDGATLYSGAEDSASQTLGDWDAGRAITDSGSWSLRNGGAGWTVTTPLADLKPDTEYELYGWTNDNSWSATGPQGFTVEELDRLEPNQVLLWNEDWAAGPEEPLNVVVDMTEFADAACPSGER
jgi:hypothetical protein